MVTHLGAWRGDGGVGNSLAQLGGQTRVAERPEGGQVAHQQPKQRQEQPDLRAPLQPRRSASTSCDSCGWSFPPGREASCRAGGAWGLNGSVGSECGECMYGQPGENPYCLSALVLKRRRTTDLQGLDHKPLCTRRAEHRWGARPRLDTWSLRISQRDYNTGVDCRSASQRRLQRQAPVGRADWSPTRILRAVHRSVSQGWRNIRPCVVSSNGRRTTVAVR